MPHDLGKGNILEGLIKDIANGLVRQSIAKQPISLLTYCYRVRPNSDPTLTREQGVPKP